jgi:hypothetical protein
MGLKLMNNFIAPKTLKVLNKVKVSNKYKVLKISRELYGFKLPHKFKITDQLNLVDRLDDSNRLKFPDGVKVQNELKVPNIPPSLLLHLHFLEIVEIKILLECSDLYVCFLGVTPPLFLKVESHLIFAN